MDEAEDVGAIGEGSVLLHIGPHKTGSTAIQQAMHLAREDLAELGVLYPGPKFRPAEAGWAVMGIGSAVGRPPPRIKLWDQLATDVGASPLPRTCVSDEDFARATDEAAERIVRDLGGDAVHLVFVARRLDRLLPSAWQERVKSRMTWSYPEFLERMAGPDVGQWDWSMLWHPHEIARVMDRWGRFVDRGRITVIVSDDQDHDLIPRTFCRLLGLPPGTLVSPTEKTNRSLSYAEAEAVRRVNEVFKEQGWDNEMYWRIVQGGVARRLKLEPSPLDRTPMPGLPADVLEVVHDRADAQIAELKASGVHVVGDPERLRTRGRVEPATTSPEVSEVSLDLVGSVVSGAVDGALRLQQISLRRARSKGSSGGLSGVPASALAAELRRRAQGRVGKLRTRLAR